MQKPCKACGTLFEATRMLSFCSDACRSKPNAARFWKMVQTSGGPLPAHDPSLGPCWLWTGSLDPKGYGWFSVGRTMRQAHRVSLELKLGRRLERHELSTHRCDNPGCVRPSHLRKGTSKSNAAEKYARGRVQHATGAANASTKLSPAQVRAIRASTAPIAALAREHGVARITIARVRRGEHHQGVQ